MQVNTQQLTAGQDAAGKLTASALKSLAREIIADPAKVLELTDDEIVDMRRELSPYGNVIAGKMSWANVSLINWQEEYLKRLYMTSLVGYIFRLCREHESRHAGQISERYAKLIRGAKAAAQFAPTEGAGAEVKSFEAQRDAEIKTVSDSEREVIEAFLNRHFNYNPDVHARNACTEPKDDPERLPRAEFVAKLRTAAADSKAARDVLCSKKEAVEEYVAGLLQETDRLVKRAASLARDAAHGAISMSCAAESAAAAPSGVSVAIPDRDRHDGEKGCNGPFGDDDWGVPAGGLFGDDDDDDAAPDAESAPHDTRSAGSAAHDEDAANDKTAPERTTAGINMELANTELINAELVGAFLGLEELAADIKTAAAAFHAAGALDILSGSEGGAIEPPSDVFYHWNRYLSNNFEQLREATNQLYNIKAGLEYCLIYYGSHASEEEAKNWRIAHNDEFRAEVQTVRNNGITFLGPFKQNRERAEFFNKNTAVLEEMLSQIESDHKLGKDLMEKKVKIQKGKNIAEAGPDAPGLADYKKTMCTINKLGAKDILSKEEKEELESAFRAKEMAEVPDDAIQVDMFYPKLDAAGNATMEKTHFYTQAEAPLHLQENSEYRDKYQPVKTAKEGGQQRAGAPEESSSDASDATGQ